MSPTELHRRLRANVTACEQTAATVRRIWPEDAELAQYCDDRRAYWLAQLSELAAPSLPLPLRSAFWHLQQVADEQHRDLLQARALLTTPEGVTQFARHHRKE